MPELSGLVQSRKVAGRFWAHGDSGNPPDLYAIDRQGRLLGIYQVAGAKNVDWEDVATDDRGLLYIGDIGNNVSDRSDLCVYVVREPAHVQKRGTLQVLRRIRFRYPDQQVGMYGLNFDAEALFTLEGRLYLLTKHWQTDRQTTLYRFPAGEAKGEVVLERLADFDVSNEKPAIRSLVTAADTSPDGRAVAVLTYENVFVFPVQGPTVLAKASVRAWGPPQRGLEALAWDGQELIVGAESGHLTHLPIPRP